MYYVYALIDPVNRLPFYIGKGKGTRAWVHLRLSEKCNKDKINYIKNIRLLGLEPEIMFIEENIIIEKEAYSSEMIYIKIAKEFFSNIITNKNGIKAPPLRKGVILTDEIKRNISLGSIGKKKPKRTLEHTINLSNALRGKKHRTGINVVCPHCHKTGNIKGMGRWHFSNCKNN